MRERKTDWAPSGRVGTSSRGRVSGRWLFVLVPLIVLGAFLLPKFTIDGRHWHLWLLP